MYKSPDFLYFHVEPEEVNFVNRILEGYEYLGVMTTIDVAKSIIMLRTTPDTKPLAVEILQSLPVAVDVLDDFGTEKT